METMQQAIGSTELKELVDGMLSDADRAQDERRVLGRLPYFQPVMLQLGDGPDLYSAFTRDVSSNGIGLLHWMPVEPQEITILNNLSDGSTIRLKVEISWCVSCGEGWYISGGKFLDAETY